MFRNEELSKILLAIIMFVIILIITPLNAAYASVEQNSSLIAGGTTSQINDFTKVSGVDWDESIKTLTITNVNTEVETGRIFAFLDNVDGEITIIINGTNIFHQEKSSSNNTSDVLFHAATPLRIKGDGTIKTTNVTAFYSKDNITIESGNINTSGRATGIWTDKNLVVNPAAKLRILNEKNDVSINGESYSVTSYDAIKAQKMTNSGSSLVKILGTLPYYAKYKNKYGIYQNYKDYSNGVPQIKAELIKYTGGKSANLYTNKTLLNGIPQRILLGRIKVGAFNNSKGKKVTSLILNNLNRVQNGTFKGLSNLKKFRYADPGFVSSQYRNIYDSNHVLKKTKVIADKAFRYMGSNSKGKKLTIYAGSKKAYKNMVKWGLYKNAKCVVVK